MSFEKKKPKNFETDIDYQSLYADGVILSPEDNDTVRMIFYENTYKFDPKNGFDKETKVSRLKFEIKMSSYVLEKLSAHLFNATMPNSIINLTKIRELNRMNPNIVKEIEKLSADVVKISFDTDNPIFNEDLQNLYFSIMDRMLREDKK